MRRLTRLRPFLSLFRPSHNHNATRTLIAAPKPNSGPLMTRRSDRALPSIPSRFRYLWTVPIFVLVLTGSAFAIFNYQKLSSSVVQSTLYALRTSRTARGLLGDEIYFASSVPWVWGSIDQLHGRIDIQYKVKGTRGVGLMRFRSERRRRMGYFETQEWSLTMSDGTTTQLLQADLPDPFHEQAVKGKMTLA